MCRDSLHPRLLELTTAFRSDEFTTTILLLILAAEPSSSICLLLTLSWHM